MNPRNPKALLSLIAVLCIVSHTASANDNPLMKSWECKLISDDFDIEYRIKLNADDTYFSEMVIMSSSTTEEGTWRSDSDKLFLKPSKTIQRGKALESRAEYERQIVGVSESKLEIKHNDAFGDPVKTLCEAK
jgi:hypothetical protein